MAIFPSHCSLSVTSCVCLDGLFYGFEVSLSLPQGTSRSGVGENGLKSAPKTLLLLLDLTQYAVCRKSFVVYMLTRCNLQGTGNQLKKPPWER